MAKQAPEFEPSLERTEDDVLADKAVAGALTVYDSALPRLHTGEPAYKQFSKEMLALVAKSIMPPNYTLPELYMGLEIAATYRLDVFTKELWLIRMKDGGPVVPLVGRDGLLAIAERHKDYRGFRNQVVHANDVFQYQAAPVERPDGSFSHVDHSYSLKDRGEIIGAWAEVYRADRPPVFFYAELGEYQRDGNTPWRKQKSAMILKCALANALRLAFRISGLYLGDEVSGQSIEARTARTAPAEDFDLELGDDPVVAQRLVDLFAVANAAVPGSWLPGEQRLELAQLDEAGRSDLVARLERQILDAGGSLPDLPDPDEAAKGIVETVADEDVEIVDEGEQATLT